VDNAKWQQEREQKRAAREARQFQRRMSSPVMRGEVASFGEAQLQHIASLALALEALEDILVGRGVLDRDELMDTMLLMSQQKAEVAVAAHAAAGSEKV
jgi:hypothetical protein